MENYGRYKNCRYADPPSEKNGYKWFCTWYGTYEDPDDIKDCPHHDED